MPRKYKTLIPLLEGEEFDYANDMNFTDDAVPSDRLPKYFEVSTGDYDPTGETPAPSVAENVQRALSCYQLRTNGMQVQVAENTKYTSGAIILKSGVHLIPGRYECRVMLPKKSNSVFSFRLFGRYTDGTRGIIKMTTPNGAVEGNIYSNIGCYTNNTNSDPVRDSKVCTISKDLNDGNFHTIGWDWYYSENHKCVKFFIDNTELTTLNVSPGFPLVLYAACFPDEDLSSQRGYFDYDYAEVDYIRFTAFANQTIDTTGAFKEDTYRGGDITETVSDNVIIPRILLANNKNDVTDAVISKVTKAQEEIIVRNFNHGNQKFTIDTNGNRDAYDYGTYSATVESKITVPSVVEATINGKKANYPVITNARAKLNKIEGNSIVWNQLIPNFIDKRYTDNVTTWMWNGDGGSITMSTEEDGTRVMTYMALDPTGQTFRLRPYVESGTSNQGYMHNLPQRYHKYLLKFDARSEGTDAEGWNWGDWYLYTNGYAVDTPRFKNTMVPNQWTTFSGVFETKRAPMAVCFFNPSYNWTAGLTGKNIGYSMRRVMMFDLTLMFGTGNEPTVEEFNRMFPEKYYAWAPDGEIKTTQIQSIKSYSSDGTELDSINLPSGVLNKDYISSSLNSQYHNGFQVTNRLKLDNYKYDGADFLGIEEFYKVKSINLGNYNWSKGTNNYYAFYDSGLNSAALNSDMGYSKSSCILCPVLSSTSPYNMANNTTTTNRNKAISFSGNAGGLYVYDSQYADAAALKTGLTGVNAYIGMSTATQYNHDVTNYLYFDDISLQISEGGYIEVAYTGFAPNVSFNFPVQLYRLYTATYSNCDISAIDSQISGGKYNTSLQLDAIKGRSVKWTQLINPENFGISQTINGMTFTINKNNGTITCNGTTTAATTLLVVKETSKIFQATPNDIICLKGCPSGGSASTYYLAFYGTTYNDFGSGVYDKLSNRRANTTDTINTSMTIAIEIASGVTMTHKVFKPQLFNVSNIYGLGKEPATITDFNKDYPYSIYPYGKQEIKSTKVSGIKISAGYKNLLDKSKFENTQTINGVTFTNNGDGSYTLNGTATAYCYFTIQTLDIPVSSNSSKIKYFMRGYEFEPGNIETNVTMYLDTFYDGLFTLYSKAGNIVERDNTYSPTNVRCRIRVAPNYTCNNLVIKPYLVNLTNLYDSGNEPTTPAQFNQDYPDIDNIPYPDTEITFSEQTLYGINDAQDILQVVKENNGYKLQKIENIGNVDLGTLTYTAQGTEEKQWLRANYSNHIIEQSSGNVVPDILMNDYITMASNNVTGQVTTQYNKTISIVGSGNYIALRDTSITDISTTSTTLSGKILYYAARNPTTTTLATLTKNQVTALFAKGYCVEILGNDDNKIIVRPDVLLKIPTDPEEIVTTINLDDQDVSDTDVEQEDTTTENFDENGSDVAVNETTEESTSDNID